MREPRNYDVELQSLDQKAKALKHRKINQLGELVIACRADMLPVDVLAGALLSAGSSDAAVQEVWRKAGAVMFQRKARSSEPRATAPALASASAPDRNRHRLIASTARHDPRDWQVKRRERTRQLIELVGLIARSRLTDLTEDDRAVIFGILVEAACEVAHRR
uniref:conjugal transfer protein TraD n=1 Tax=Sphingomonas populi TaxID=2484750 RepID=UPI00269EC228